MTSSKCGEEADAQDRSRRRRRKRRRGGGVPLANLGYVLNMLVHWAGPTRVRPVRAEFPQRVLDGDCVSAGGRLVSLARAGDETLAEGEVWLDRQDGVRSVAARAWVAIARAPS